MGSLVDLNGNRASVDELNSKLDRVEARLGRLEPEGARLALLASLLRQQTPLSFFIRPDADSLVSLLQTLYAFLNGRDGEVDVALRQLWEQGHSLLLVNTTDAPFLLHSLQSILIRQQLPFHVVSHPILSIARDADGITAIGGLDQSGLHESLILIEIEQQLDVPKIESLRQEVISTLSQVQVVERSRQGLADRLQERVAAAEKEKDFWFWLTDGNFKPFSYKQFSLGSDGTTIRENSEVHLGLPWKVVTFAADTDSQLKILPEVFRTRLDRPAAVVVEQTQRNSPFSLREKLVYIGCRQVMEDGLVVEHAFLGQFSQQSVDQSTMAIPELRQKVEEALQTLCIPADSHDWRKTVEIFNTFPKVELFFMATEELLETVRSLTHLYRHGAVKVVPAHSLNVRGLTLLVIMPANYYDPTGLPRLTSWLRRFFRTDIVDSRLIHLSGHYLSLHVNIQSSSGWEPAADIGRLERGLTRLARPWSVRLRHQLERHFGEAEALILEKRWKDAFSDEYQHLIHPRFALRDLQALEALQADREERFDLWGPFAAEDGEFFRLQFYSTRRSYLNELMPFLENLNLNIIDEVDFTVSSEIGELFIKSFSIRGTSAVGSLSRLRPVLLEALRALDAGQLENDYLNRLIPLTNLSWQQIDLFRAYRNYYFQLGSPYSKRSVAFALINNPDIARLLYRYFAGRFDPDGGEVMIREEQLLMPLRLELIAALEQVKDINEDSILRIMFNLIDSTVRSNFFLRQGKEDYFLSFKISAIGIIDMPAPRPLYETYVHNSAMEGIHLRGGKVARGGIRWSDRPDDFRTEVLGLMKTQMTKNALIVPVGSKGGFVVKQPFQGREEGAALSKAAYQTLMRGLLDLSDNRIGGRIVRPEGIVAYDSEDPYLVVAADKGTAHLPDTANGVSRDYGFWLQDAFASGGSKGYDHKKLGITARGAWVCVQRHFRELGIDVQNQSVTVVGIGDMSGDVFGNGMLQSRQTKLVAAFNHMHIFLDPDPEPEAAWQERQRLFNLPRSTWADYKPELISAGGGLFDRQAKEIPLSPEVRKLLGVRHKSMDGQGLIRLLLTAEVDLLWNGGIGTYVKAIAEKHDDAGDRANDGVRIDSNELRARVVGEGGNLGMTQPARVEYALAGGRLNTDAIDNSAGVDCSDHEVNLKIFLHRLMESGKVENYAERDLLLADAADAVCEQVLHNNYTQSLCISLDQLQCDTDNSPYLDLLDRLVEAGLLDRRGEDLPTAREVMARPGQSLARPELSILLAYSKMQLFQSLLDVDLLGNHAGVTHCLETYFPTEIQSRFKAEIAHHPLAAEIAATMLTNLVIDQAGATFVVSMARDTGATLAEAAFAYLSFDRLFDGAGMRQAVYKLDNRVAVEVPYRLLLTLEGLLARFCYWGLVKGIALPRDLATEQQWQALLHDYCDYLRQSGPEDLRLEMTAKKGELEQHGIPADRAEQLASLNALEDFLTVVTLAEQADAELAAAAETLTHVDRKLHLAELQSRLSEIAIRDRWDRQALQALESRLGNLRFEVARRIWQDEAGKADRFFSARRTLLQGYRGHLTRLAGTPRNLHPFLVLVGALERLLD